MHILGRRTRAVTLAGHSGLQLGNTNGAVLVVCYSPSWVTTIGDEDGITEKSIVTRKQDASLRNPRAVQRGKWDDVGGIL